MAITVEKIVSLTDKDYFYVILLFFGFICSLNFFPTFRFLCRCHFQRVMFTVLDS